MINILKNKPRIKSTSLETLQSNSVSVNQIWMPATLTQGWLEYWSKKWSFIGNNYDKLKLETTSRTVKERTYFEAIPLHKSSDEINAARAIVFEIPNEMKLRVIKRWAIERQLGKSCEVGRHNRKARSVSERNGGKKLCTQYWDWTPYLLPVAWRARI